jgi:hypothetical protein
VTAQTTAQRQAAYRTRKAAANLPEVRGIFAPTADHPAIKAAAVKLSARQGVVRSRTDPEGSA